MRLVTEGRNRFVLLTRRHAIKVPSLRCWRDFLFGMLNNMNEATWHREHAAYCPVVWAAPLGLAIVMPRVQPLAPDVFAQLLRRRLLPPVRGVERKASSWGMLDGQLVATDYGWR